MEEPTKRKKKDEDEVTLAKSIFDEIIEETERDESKKPSKQHQDDSKPATKAGAFAVR